MDVDVTVAAVDVVVVVDAAAIAADAAVIAAGAAVIAADAAAITADAADLIFVLAQDARRTGKVSATDTGKASMTQAGADPAQARSLAAAVLRDRKPADAAAATNAVK